MLKIVALLFGIFSAPNLFACSMTPIGASNLQLQGVIKQVTQQYSSRQNSMIQNILAVDFSKFVVTMIDSQTKKLVGEHKYAVSIGSDCSIKVVETGP